MRAAGVDGGGQKRDCPFKEPHSYSVSAHECRRTQRAARPCPDRARRGGAGARARRVRGTSQGHRSGNRSPGHRARRGAGAAALGVRAGRWLALDHRPSLRRRRDPQRPGGVGAPLAIAGRPALVRRALRSCSPSDCTDRFHRRVARWRRPLRHSATLLRSRRRLPGRRSARPHDRPGLGEADVVRRHAAGCARDGTAARASRGSGEARSRLAIRALALGAARRSARDAPATLSGSLSRGRPRSARRAGRPARRRDVAHRSGPTRNAEPGCGRGVS